MGVFADTKQLLEEAKVNEIRKLSNAVTKSTVGGF